MKRLILILLCGAVAAPIHLAAQEEVAPGVLLLGRFADTNINESSGVIPSHRGRGAFWTHNDGDNNLFAFTAGGTSLGQWRFGGPLLHDFEDVAWSPGRIYLADIGNNDLLREHVLVYSVPEPGPTFSGTLPLKGRWKLTYPNGERFDAESFLVRKRKGYVIAKDLTGGEARIFRFPLKLRPRPRATFELEPQCELDVDAPVGGADLTRDGNRLAVITEAGAYLFSLPGGIPETGRIEPTLFVPFSLELMEGCAFTRNGLIVTAETGEILLFTNDLFKLPPRPRRR